MDISRLPTVSGAQPVSSPRQNTHRALPPTGATDVESADAWQRTPASSGVAIQGELLHRDQGQYQSTRSFLDERALGQARPAGPLHEAFDSRRTALSLYQRHARAESPAASSPGQAVNLMV